jgi:hypothetical protein
MPFELAQLQTPFAGNPDEIEQMRRPPAALRGVVTKERAEIHQQLLGRQVVVKVRVLGKVADAPFDSEVSKRPSQNLGSPGGPARDRDASARSRR